MPSTLEGRPARRQYRRPSRLAEYVAPRLGLRPATVEQLVHGHAALPTRFAALVEGAVVLGDLAILAKLIGPVEAALGKLAPVRCTGELELAEEAADGVEDLRRAEHQLHPTRETARDRVTAIRCHRMRLLVLERALCTEWELP